MSEFFSNINWERVFCNLDANSSYDVFLKHYETACNIFVPTRKLKNRDRSCAWMNKEIRTQLKMKNKLWFRCRASGFKNTTLLAEYKHCQIETKRSIYKARCTFEMNLALKSKTNPKILYKYINNFDLKNYN
jgi:hypothetical protein